MNDHSSEFGTTGSPTWAPDQLPAFHKGLEMLASGRVTTIEGRVTLDPFEASMNAFASIIIPRDPNATPPDHAAGDLVSVLKGQNGKQTITFGRQMILLIREGSPADFGVRIDEADDGVPWFAELDAQATALFGRPTFADLAKHDPAGAASLVQRLLVTLDLTPIVIRVDADDGDGDADADDDAKLVAQTLGRKMVIIVKIAYWLNFPEHRVRTGELGFGSGKLIFSDPAHQIENPNDITTGTGFDYLKWHYPLRFGVEQDYALAFLEASVNPKDSDKQLEELIAEDEARTLIREP